MSRANRQLGLYKEGIQQVNEAWETIEQFGATVAQARCLIDLARLLRDDNQLDAAEETTFRAIGLIPEEGRERLVCQSHHILGGIC